MKRLLLLAVLLVGCRGPKLTGVYHCDEECAPEGVSLTVLNRGSCSPGRWDCTVDGGRCVGAVLPVAETCGEKDLDCDGIVGNVAPRYCQNVCGAHSTQSCTNGAWGECLTAPSEFSSPEVCNGKDDNCNGQVDEGLAATPCYDGAGGVFSPDFDHPNTACRLGTRLCQNGSLGACLNEVLPQPEICDGIDNNCDGTIDENCDLKVTLTWDIYNEDLDIHLGIPTPDGGLADGGVDPAETDWFYSKEYDCFYGDCTSGIPVGYAVQWDDGGFENPVLNRDDLYYVGPEIIDVVEPVNTHPYFVAVHWYDLPGNHMQPTGTVTVTCGGTVIYTGSHFFANKDDAWFAGAVYANTDDGGLGCKFTPNGAVIGGEP